jgi:hypothetical protein
VRERVRERKRASLYQMGETALYYNYKRKREKMTVTRKSAGIEISDIVEGYLVSKLYIGYTVKEAKQLFNAEYKRGSK